MPLRHRVFLTAALVAAFSASLFGQGSNFGVVNQYLPSTVARLPAASTANKNWARRITDPQSATDCTSGGGSYTTTIVICVSDGTAWVATGGGGSSSSAALSKDFPIAAAQNSNYSLGGSCGTDCPTPAAPAASAAVNEAVAQFSASAANSLTFQIVPPTGWTGATLVIQLDWDTTTGDVTKSVVWSVSTSCPAAGSSFDATYNTAATTTTAANASASRRIVSTITLTSGAGNLTGCAAGGLMNIKIARATPGAGSDNLPTTANVAHAYGTGT